MGWFTKTPPIQVGDIVIDSWSRIAGPREVKVERIERKGVFASEQYYVRTVDTGYLCDYPRSRSDLKPIPRAQEKKPVAIDLRNQPPMYTQSDIEKDFERLVEAERIRRDTKIRAERELARLRAIRNTPQEPRRSAWFDVIAKKDTMYMSGKGAILEVKEGSMLRMRALSDGTYEVETAGEHIRLNERSATKVYEKYDINDYATEYPRRKTKEDEDMGGELYGYPPEDNEEVARIKAEADSVIARNRARIQELEAALKEKEQKYEVARREKVAEEYGIVAERHLWSVTVDVPMQWSGKRPYRGGEQKSEVLTEGRNMVEAAMAAEAMAKGISEKAYVLSIDYVRVIGAIK